MAENGPDVQWRLSLLSSDPGRDAVLVREFNRKYEVLPRAGAIIDSVEIKIERASDLEPVEGTFPPQVRIFCELSVNSEISSLLTSVAKHGFNAKIRCGGMSAAQFPSVAQLVRFLEECRTAGAGFKATAGLHHPLRGNYRVSDEPDSPKATMHGFLNLFLCAAWIRSGLSSAEAVELLEERTEGALRFSERGVAWRDHYIGAPEIAATRREFALAFGSCSFAEPVSDLRRLDLI